MELHAKYTLIAEGARGSLAKHADRQVRPARRRRSAEVRHRHQGAVAGRSGQASRRAWWCIRRAGRCRRPTATAAPSCTISATTSSPSASWCISSYENPYLSPFDEFQRFKTHPEVAKYLQGRQAAGLRLARHQRGRRAVGAQAHLPGRRADRLLGGLRQRAAHQGQPQRDQERHAGAPRRPSRRWPRARPAATS